MTWQNFVLQQQKVKKSHATKLCSFKVIHHFVENEVITYDIICSAFKLLVNPIFYS